MQSQPTSGKYSEPHPGHDPNSHCADAGVNVRIMYMRLYSLSDTKLNIYKQYLPTAAKLFHLHHATVMYTKQMMISHSKWNLSLVLMILYWEFIDTT